MNKYYVSTPKGVLGPFLSSEIIEQVSHGKLHSNDLCWPEGSSNKKPLGALIQLQAETAPTISYRKVFIFLALAAGFCLVGYFTWATWEESTTTSRANMKQRSLAAWRELQAVDTRLSNRPDKNDMLPSALCREYAYQYSFIPLEGIDPILENHIRNTISVLQKAALTYQAFEQEAAKLQDMTDAGMDLGYLLGAVASDEYNPQADALVGAFLGGLVGEAARQAAIDDLLNKWDETFQMIIKSLEDLNTQTKTTSHELEQKYATPFPLN